LLVAFVHTSGYNDVEVNIMTRTANLHVRIDPATKSCAEEVFSQFGITVSDAITIFLRKSIMVGGLPFDVVQPRYNAETEAAMEEARGIMATKGRYNHV